MRRILLMAIASSALLLALPAGASAHHRGHHSRHHLRHHARHASVRHFGHLAGTTTTSPTSPSSPTPAGTVKSFEGGVLTITLPDSSTVSGKVTEDTEIRCVKEGSSGDEQDDDAVEHHAFAADNGDDDNQGDDNDQGDDDNSQNCTVAALVPGAIVLGAELKLGPSGAVWTHVDVKA